MPLIAQHVASEGERIPPSSDGYLYGFFSARYFPRPLDLANADQGLCFVELVSGYFSGFFSARYFPWPLDLVDVDQGF